jgi:hypothetical protein
MKVYNVIALSKLEVKQAILEIWQSTAILNLEAFCDFRCRKSNLNKTHLTERAEEML